MLLLCNHMIFLAQFGINKHCNFSQRPQIATLLVLEKFTSAYLFQIALEIMQ